MKTTIQTMRKHIADIHSGKNNGETIFYTHSDTGIERFAHDLIRMRHSGYYTDSECYALARGIVVTLPETLNFPNGRFLAGYYWTDNGERVIYPELFDTPEDAARMADSHAEQFAEMQREDSKRFDAMQKAEFDAESAREDATHAIQARNVSAWHRNAARESIETLREALQDLADKTAAYEKG